jgi:hypothetical protein
MPKLLAVFDRVRAVASPTVDLHPDVRTDHSGNSNRPVRALFIQGASRRDASGGAYQLLHSAGAAPASLLLPAAATLA